MNPPPITIAARPEATTVDFVWKFRGCVRAEKALAKSREAGRFPFVRRSFSAHKYEPSPYVCQACKHNILCLSFRSLARCGRLPSPQKSTDFLSEKLDPLAELAKHAEPCN